MICSIGAIHLSLRIIRAGGDALDGTRCSLGMELPNPVFHSTAVFLLRA
jgi:hypothetical protein